MWKTREKRNANKLVYTHRNRDLNACACVYNTYRGGVRTNRITFVLCLSDSCLNIYSNGRRKIIIKTVKTHIYIVNATRGTPKY